MKRYETREVPARTTQVQIELTCDLCGVKASRHSGWQTFDDNALETTVEWKDGNSYPEGGSGTEIKIDICPKCFLERLVPWVESQEGMKGRKIVREDWDW